MHLFLKPNNLENWVVILHVFIINMIPVLGYLFWGWDMFHTIFYYWIETSIAGLFSLIIIFKSNSTYGLTDEHGRNVSRDMSRIGKVFFYLGFTYLYFMVFGGTMGIILGFIFVFFDPTTVNGITPNGRILSVFGESINFIYLTFGIYFLRFFNNLRSGNFVIGSEEVHQRNLFLRIIILVGAFTFLWTIKFLFGFTNVFVGILIFLALRIIVEVDLAKRMNPKDL